MCDNCGGRQAAGDDQSEVRFDESDLDTITVGNFRSFQTGQLNRSGSTDGQWEYSSCVGDEMDCVEAEDVAQHIPAQHNEPLAFIQTDESFIADHNDGSSVGVGPMFVPSRSLGSSTTALTSRTESSVREWVGQLPRIRCVTVVFSFTVTMTFLLCIARGVGDRNGGPNVPSLEAR